jgi:site-specific DNA-methyltransferase (adenine-specific)
VASLAESDQKKLLDLAERNEFTVKDMQHAVAKLKSGRNGKETEFPKGKFGVIYADCPWLYDRSVGQGVAVEQYDLMELAEIKNLEDAEGRKVQDLSGENCLLFLWATFPKLTEALETIAAWGFEYKTVGFTWIKTNKKNDKPFFGIGSYTKSNAEVCLLGTKGDPHILVKDNSVSSVIMSPLREHSRKPDEARAGIEKLVGSIPKIELFAREKVKGWETWGRETGKF